MSIITFWNDSREQTGQTLSAVAVATKIAIERNNKVLLVSTSIDDNTISECYWEQANTSAIGLFKARNSTIAVENGIEGLLKLAMSNKLEPNIITDYTKVVLKGRLEVITGPTSFRDKTEEENLSYFKKVSNSYIDLIRVANQYYDYVIVDLDKKLNVKIKEDILKLSDINLYILIQKMESLNKYIELKSQNNDLMKNRCIPTIGRYIKEYKYNAKNMARYLQEKKELNSIPFNLLYMESAEEANVVDLFLKLRTIKDKTDPNYIFMQNILDLTNNIFKKLQELQMRMR